MLIRSHDAGGPDEWRAFVEEQAFGHFVASGVDHAVPVIVPTQFVLGDDAVLFHLAAANPVFDRLREAPDAILSVAGDWAYIPGDWKAIGGEDPRMGIPTTYYGAVQITGQATILDSAHEIAATLRHQLADLQPADTLADPDVHTKKFSAIRAVHLSIEEVRSKFKYGGNVDQAHRDAIGEKLTQRAEPGDGAAASRIVQD